MADALEKRPNDDFAAEAAKPKIGLASEFVQFLRDNKKWWLLPLLAIILLQALLLMLSGSAAAPFIYPLF